MSEDRLPTNVWTVKSEKRRFKSHSKQNIPDPRRVLYQERFLLCNRNMFCSVAKHKGIHIKARTVHHATDGFDQR